VRRYLVCFAAIIGVLLLSHGEGQAWWSFGPGSLTTHHELTKSAISLLSPSEDRDIYKFRSLLEDGTTSPTNDNNAHGQRYRNDAGNFNGGPIRRWWGLEDDAVPSTPTNDLSKHGVLPQYRAFNFSSGEYSAYCCLALMAHLIEDQVAPPHAANISHALPSHLPDNFEAHSSDFAPHGVRVVLERQLSRLLLLSQ
jgi:hypothetical protein